MKTSGADVLIDGAMAPDTGQSPAEEQAKHLEEPQAAAAASASSPTTTNNANGSNYNLVTSLLNLTKSPVSNSTPTPPAVLIVLVTVTVGWIGERCIVSVLPQDGRIVVKACEGLMLLVSLPEPAAAKCLTENTELCELLTDKLVSFYKALPQSMDPLDIETVESVNWGYVSSCGVN